MLNVREIDSTKQNVFSIFQIVFVLELDKY